MLRATGGQNDLRLKVGQALLPASRHSCRLPRCARSSTRSRLGASSQAGLLAPHAVHTGFHEHLYHNAVMQLVRITAALCFGGMAVAQTVTVGPISAGSGQIAS